MKCVLIVLIVLFSACGGDSPTAPTRPQYPDVAGRYSGTVSIFYPQVGRTLACPATTAVTQNGNLVSIAPVALTGACGSLSIPVGDLTIDENGSLGNQTGSVTDPCGLYTYSASGGFFGREYRFSLIYASTSSRCITFNVTGTLTR